MTTEAPTPQQPILGTIARLAMSALIVLLAEPLYLMEDLAVVGRLGATPLAALGAGTVILGVVSTQLTFLSYGTTARSARLFGRGDRAAAIGEGVAASWLAIGVGIAIIAVMQVISPWVAALIASDEQVATGAASWLRIAVCGVPLILLSMAGNGWMRGVQDARRPVIFVTLGLGISAILCPLLVHGFAGFAHLGLNGSAVANLIGQSIAGLFFLSRLVREGAASGAWQLLRPRWQVITAQMSMGRDLIVRSLSFQVCFLSAAAVAARCGVAALAAHQVVLQLWNFISLLLDALAIAAQALVGQALGAGAQAHARRIAGIVTYASLALSMVVMVLLSVARTPITAIFTNDADVVYTSATPWWFLVAMMPIAGVVFALDGVLLGSGDAAYLRTITVVSAFVGFLPMIWLSLAFGWGLAGIWTGLSAFMACRLVAVGVRVISGRWARAAV